MEGRFEGRVALVTGGSSGIGRATALAFAREGAKVVIADIHVKGGEETVRLIKEGGGEGLFVQTNVAKEAEVEYLIKKIADTFKRLECAFNNAGIGGSMATTAEYKEQDWNEMMEIDLKGVWLCMKHEILLMLKNGGGAIVNTSSDAGLVGTPNTPAYTAAKHGVIGLTKTAALEYAKTGIRVNAVCPGPIRTEGADELWKKNPWMEEFILNVCPMGRIGNPEEVAESVLWLCSEGASYVTGAFLTVDGGIAAQ